MTQPMIRLLQSEPDHRRRAALFLDRDGVLNRRIPGGYVLSPEQMQILPAALPAARAARKAGAAVVVVTNQGAIGRGLLDEAGLLRVHGALITGLERGGVHLDGTYVCPHHPLAVCVADRSCGCRKPAPGLLLAAARDLNLDLGASVLIGDQASDVLAAEAAGLPEAHIVRFDSDEADEAGVADLTQTVVSRLG